MTSPHILLVEDEEHIAQGLFFNLEQEGYLVTHVETGSEAMRAFDNEHFDLVVLDLMLPDSHGIDLCQRMRETSPQLPILILTALGEEQNRVKGLQAGADFMLNEHWLINLDLRYIALETDASVGGGSKFNVTIDPWVYTLAVGYKF